MKIDRRRDGVLDELRRFEHERGPNGAAVGRMTERLTEAGVLGGGASPSAERGPERSSVRWKPAAVALVIAGGVLFGSHQVRTHGPPTRAVPPSSIHEPLEHASNPATSAERDPAAVASGPPVLSIDDLPSAAPRAAATSSAAAPAPTTTIAVRERRSHEPGASKAAAETGAEDGAVSELALVRRARAALETDPSEALVTTAEHARVFPTGEFVQEREVIAVEALVRLGRKAEAVRRAESLVRQFPRTPYAVRLEKAIGQPLSPAP